MRCRSLSVSLSSALSVAPMAGLGSLIYFRQREWSLTKLRLTTGSQHEWKRPCPWQRAPACRKRWGDPPSTSFPGWAGAAPGPSEGQSENSSSLGFKNTLIIIIMSSALLPRPWVTLSVTLMLKQKQAWQASLSTPPRIIIFKQKKSREMQVKRT